MPDMTDGTFKGGKITWLTIVFSAINLTPDSIPQIGYQTKHTMNNSKEWNT